MVTDSKFDANIEKAILSAIINFPKELNTVAALLEPKHFYIQTYQIIYEALVRMQGKGTPIDILTLTAELKSKQAFDSIGGILTIVELSSYVMSAANVEYHAKILIDLFTSREINRIANNMNNENGKENGDVSAIINNSVSELINLATVGTSEIQHISEIAPEVTQIIKQRKNNPDAFSKNSILSGFTKFDKIIGTFEPGDLVIIAARPAMGKTTFAQAIAKNIALSEKSVAFFSLEMTKAQMVNRFIVEIAGINSNDVKTGNINDMQMQRIFNAEFQLYDLPIFIDDTSALSMPKLRSKLMLLKNKYNIKACVFDYIQLGMSGENNKVREVEVATISRNLKSIAKDLGIVMFALSQLSRANEGRTNKRPLLSDLRESGSIEQDADVVMFLHRPEKYGETEYSDGTSTQGVCEIIVEKFRNGATGTIPLKFAGEFFKFYNFEDENNNDILNGFNGTIPF